MYKRYSEWSSDQSTSCWPSALTLVLMEKAYMLCA